MDIRELEPRDLRFLRRMLITALLWRPKRRLWPTSVLLLHPEAGLYHRRWGRPGDAGCVAWDGTTRLGAVWVRRFTDDEHGDGYLDAETPELAIGVIPAARGRGVGRALMEAMHERARRDGVPRISLSVHPENPAKRLYASLGYEDRGGELMVLEL